MRLSVQMLQRNIENGKATPEQTQRTANTLIEQIDALSDIASSFSRYAKLPENHPQPLDLAELVGNVVNLYDNAENITFNYIFTFSITIFTQKLSKFMTRKKTTPSTATRPTWTVPSATWSRTPRKPLAQSPMGRLKLLCNPLKQILLSASRIMARASRRKTRDRFSCPISPQRRVVRA